MQTLINYKKLLIDYRIRATNFEKQGKLYCYNWNRGRLHAHEELPMDLTIKKWLNNVGNKEQILHLAADQNNRFDNFNPIDGWCDQIMD